MTELHINPTDHDRDQAARLEQQRRVELLATMAATIAAGIVRGGDLVCCNGACPEARMSRESAAEATVDLARRILATCEAEP